MSQKPTYVRPLTIDERIDLRKQLLICAENYFNGLLTTSTTCGICNALATQTGDDKYYEIMEYLLSELFMEHTIMLGDYTNTPAEWEGRAYMCLFLAEYLQDTIEGRTYEVIAAKKPWYKFW